MAIKEPASMDDLVYFTRRNIGKGKAVAWAYRQMCPKCKKAKMGKPVEKGKVKIRALEYKCPECAHVIPKQEYEDSLTAEVIYTCPHCNFSGDASVPFKRKKVKLFDEEAQKDVTAESLRIQCKKCAKNIDITKKMK